MYSYFTFSDFLQNFFTKKCKGYSKLYQETKKNLMYLGRDVKASYPCVLGARGARLGLGLVE